jgi:hypothetical protein
VDIPAAIRNATVADLVSHDGSWNLNIINWLPVNILNLIVAIPPPKEENGGDINLWANDKHGQFTVASAYELIMNYEPCDDEKIWTTIWRLHVPERI